MAPTSLLSAARDGLTASPKTMPPVWFYDRRGSELFEAITKQPEYYPTETEREILRYHAPALVDEVGTPVRLVELGAGSAYKTRELITRILERQEKVHFAAIDISREAIRSAEQMMQQAFDAVIFHGIIADNRQGLSQLDPTVAERYLILFLGSSLGNMHPPDAAAWLASITAHMRPDDRFLLGLDRHKDRDTLERAYDDAAGVTAAFNLNLLARLNRELGADFDLDDFEHCALYNEDLHRVEMHLKAKRDHAVKIPGLDAPIPFAAGETIHTECSYKYTDQMIAKLLEEAGLEVDARHADPKGAFNVLLLRKGAP